MTVTGELKANNFKGMIVAYSGDVSGIPVGWALCDGTNETPDLRGRFIFGFNPNDKGPTNANGDIFNDARGNPLRQILKNKMTGGEEYHQLTVDELPQHSHYLNYKFGLYSDCHGGGGSAPCQADINNDNLNKTTSVGINLPHNNMPPYMVLAYVMKL